MTTTSEQVIDLTISAEDSDPKIWRRLYVPSSMPMDKLHEAIQSVMGWLDYHLHEFVVDDRRIGCLEYENDFLGEDVQPLEDERTVSIDGLFDEGIRRFQYFYDFGDGWDLTVTMSRSFSTSSEPADRIICVDGARSGPLEDCGGWGGFEELCRVLADPDHPEYVDYLDWVPPGFKPEHFSVAGANWILANRETEDQAVDHLIGWMGAIPPHLTMTERCYQELWWSLMAPVISDEEQAGKAAQAVREAFAARHLHSETGLTVGQYTALIAAKPGALTPTVVINEDLADDVLVKIPQLANALAFLRMLDEEGTLRATTKGNLPRAFVYRFIGQMVAAGEIWGAPREVQSWNEDQSWPVRSLRETLHKAGLMKLRKGKFSLTRRGNDLIQTGRHGALLSRLIKGTITYSPKPDEIEGWRAAFNIGWGYMLYSWAGLDNTWRNPRELVGVVLPQFTRDRILVLEGEMAVPVLLGMYFLNVLESFGLAESRVNPASESTRWPDRQYRPSSLVGDLITFAL